MTGLELGGSLTIKELILGLRKVSIRSQVWSYNGYPNFRQFLWGTEEEYATFYKRKTNAQIWFGELPTSG